MSKLNIPKEFLEMFPEGTQHKLIEIENYTIHYVERGKGIPIFMMHGNPTWSFLYRDIMANLDPEKYRCIAPDLVGLGFSSKHNAADFHTLENHERIMSKFLKEVIKEDFLFVGQDWGGPIGLLAAMNHPKNIKGMLLLNTMIRPPKKDFKPTAFHFFSRMPIISDFVFRVLDFPQSYLHTAQGKKSSIQGKVRKAYTYPLRKMKDNKAPLMLARMVPNTPQHPSIPYLQKTEDFAATYKGPVTLFWGKKDPILGRLSSAHQKLMPQAKVQLTDGGHFIQEEYPELIAKAISELIH